MSTIEQRRQWDRNKRALKRWRADQQARYEIHFDALLRYDPTFVQECIAQGEAWVRDHYNGAALEQRINACLNRGKP